MYICTYVSAIRNLPFSHLSLKEPPSLIHRHGLDKLIHLRHRRLLRSFELPRTYAKSFIKSANNEKWDSFNPRSLA